MYKSEFEPPSIDMDSKLTFGQYKGKYVSWVVENDPTYIHWLAENTKVDIDDEVFEVIENGQ